MTQKHENTTVKIDPPFDEAIKKLARAKRAGSQPETGAFVAFP